MTIKDLISELYKYDETCEVEVTDPASLMVKDTDGKWYTIMDFWTDREGE